jgi:hypothetical protein
MFPGLQSRRNRYFQESVTYLGNLCQVLSKYQLYIQIVFICVFQFDEFLQDICGKDDIISRHHVDFFFCAENIFIKFQHDFESADSHARLVQVTVFALDVVGGLAAAERLHDPGKDLVQPKFKWHLLANFEQNLEGDHFHLRVETGGVEGTDPLHHYHTGEFIVAFER